jgi:hypothetical protein
VLPIWIPMRWNNILLTARIYNYSRNKRHGNRI